MEPWRIPREDELVLNVRLVMMPMVKIKTPRDTKVRILKLTILNITLLNVKAIFFDSSKMRSKSSIIAFRGILKPAG